MFLICGLRKQYQALANRTCLAIELSFPSAARLPMVRYQCEVAEEEKTKLDEPLNYVERTSNRPLI